MPRSRCRRSRPEPALLLGLVALVAACSSGGDAAPEHQHRPDPPDVTIGEPDIGFVGPQGRVAQFVVECRWSHVAEDDPIVWPGEPGKSHTHEFFGNTSTDAWSTLSSLAGEPTTCDQQLDRASYWVPALYDGDTRVVPEKVTAYYRPGPSVDPTTIQPFPTGIQLLGGDPAAETPQPIERVSWTCGTGAEREHAPFVCPADRGLRMIVTFPDCWDGEHLATDDHRSHASYSHDGSCDAAHPVPLPQLTIAVAYPPVTGTPEFELASGGEFSAHGDFFNAWDEDKLASEVDLCLHRGLVCGITSGRKTG